MRKLIFTFFILTAAYSFSQELLNDSLLKEDFEILKTIVTEVSPNLNLNEKESVNAYLNSKEQELDGKSMNVIEFFRFLMSLKAETKMDEHCSLSLSNEVIKDLLTDKPVLFPIPIVIMDNALVVNHDNAQIPYGSIIKEINGMPIETILDDFLREKSTYALRNLEQSFDLLYLIKFGTPQSFEVKYSLPNSNLMESMDLNPIDVKTRESLYASNVYPINREQLKNLINTAYFEESNTYYIQLNSFNWKEDIKNVYEAFDNAFEDIFKTIKKQNPENLIIDLRYNKGGNIMIPALFYSYMALQDFNELVNIRVPDFDLPYKNHIEKIGGRSVNTQQVDEFIANFQKPFTKNNDFYELNYIDNINHKPKKNNFKGKVYLLIGGRNYSAASYFTAIFKANKRGMIVGEEIGGSHHNITAGQLIEYELPNTKITTALPIAVFKFSPDIESGVPEPKIIPDIVLSEPLKYQYFLKKEDGDLQETIKLINDKN